MLDLQNYLIEIIEDNALEKILNDCNKRFKVSWNISHLTGRTSKDKVECSIFDKYTNEEIANLAFIEEGMELNNYTKLRMIIETLAIGRL